MKELSGKRSFRALSMLLICLLLAGICFSVAAFGAEDDDEPSPEISSSDVSQEISSEEEPSSLPEEDPEDSSDVTEPSSRPENSSSAGKTPSPVNPHRDKQVSDLLNTDDHTAYMRGYTNGMFKPDAGVTRAEAAQMFYSLLRRQDGERVFFPDIMGKWHENAVSIMAGLGMLHGYPDGTFRPENKITRAEFVTIAAQFVTLTEEASSFPDVPDSHWAASFISTAAAKGWVTGDENGFRPDATITRAETVIILNKMLGRSPDPVSSKKNDVKNFYDLFPTHWAYAHIAEASTDHTYTSDGRTETWTDYTRDTEYPTKSGWVKDGGTMYYLDAATRKFLRGEQTIDGKKYLLNSSTGAAFTGFRTEGSWRRYYKDGLLMDDISGLGVVSGPYFIKVYKSSNYLIVFAKDDAGNYNTPVRAMRASCGYSTILGTYYTPARYRWLRMVGYVWGQWCTQISGNYLFHSVPNYTYSNMDLEVEEYNHLGETRSAGCVRLNCEDAKWIYDNCVLGTKVTITDSETSGPLSKPAGIQIPSWHTWDPTDPTAQWKCKEKGCH